MSKSKIEIDEREFDYSLYFTSSYEFFTKDGRNVNIIDYAELDDSSNEKTFIGTIDVGNGKSIINTWDEKGISLNNNEDLNLIMRKEIKPNYDHITSNDVPDTDDFKEKYDDFCKYSFKMSPVEYLRYKEFCKDHRNCCSNTGAIGGGIYVSFMPTGLGNVIHAKCDICGLEVDLTDETCW